MAAAASLAAVRHAAPNSSSSAQTPLALASAARTRRRTWTVRAASLEPRAARGTALSVAPARARRPGARLSGALGQPVRQIWTAATVEPLCSARTASSLGLFRVCRVLRLELDGWRGLKVSRYALSELIAKCWCVEVPPL
jgi:hypothetical protein